MGPHFQSNGKSELEPTARTGDAELTYESNIDQSLDSQTRERAVLDSLTHRLRDFSKLEPPTSNNVTVVPATDLPTLKKQIEQIERDLKEAHEVEECLYNYRAPHGGRTGAAPVLMVMWSSIAAMNIASGRPAWLIALDLVVAGLYGMTWAISSKRFNGFFSKLGNSPEAQANRLAEAWTSPDVSSDQAARLKQQVLDGQSERIKSLEVVRADLTERYSDLSEIATRAANRDLSLLAQSKIIAEIPTAQVRDTSSVFDAASSSDCSRDEILQALALIDTHFEAILSGSRLPKPETAGAQILLEAVQRSLAGISNNYDKQQALFENIEVLRACLDLH